MAVADLFLRSKPKLQSTDLWLHTAGAEGGALPSIFASGTVTTIVQPTAVEALADTQGLVAVAAFTDAGALSDIGSVLAIATISAGEALTDTGLATGLSVPSGAETLLDTGTVQTVALLTATFSGLDVPPVGLIEPGDAATGQDLYVTALLTDRFDTSRSLEPVGSATVAGEGGTGTSSVDGGDDSTASVDRRETAILVGG